jgi:hypothetical protein
MEPGKTVLLVLESRDETLTASTYRLIDGFQIATFLFDKRWGHRVVGEQVAECARRHGANLIVLSMKLYTTEGRDLECYPLGLCPIHFNQAGCPTAQQLRAELEE